jgi:ubiquitin C-terminal hydrolase
MIEGSDKITTNFLYDIFGIKQMKLKQCTECKMETNILDENLVSFFTINIINNNNKNIQDYINNEFARVLLNGDNSVICDKCNKKTEHTKAISFANNPINIILSLAYSSQEFDPIYPDNIFKTIKKQLNYTEQIDINGAKYEIYGVVSHRGGNNSGHYVSFVKYKDIKDNKYKWGLINDSIITENVKFNDISDPNYKIHSETEFYPYLLFCKLITPNPKINASKNKYLKYKTKYNTLKKLLNL